DPDVSGVASDGGGYVRTLLDDVNDGVGPIVARFLIERTSQGDAANDTIVGDTLVDVMHGGGGDDTLVGGKGNDQLVGGAGIDTASSATSDAAVQVDLTRTGPQTSTGDANADTLTTIENLLGSRFGDALTGNNAANLLRGGAGNDILHGGADKDTLDGGAGADTLDGGTELDTATYRSSHAALPVLF